MSTVLTASGYSRHESRSSPRFVPRDSLSISVPIGMPFVVHGDMTDLSEVGARVTTPAMLERDRTILVDVRNGYSFLFRAQARIIWASELLFLEDQRICVQGILFTALSPFSRKLIQRLGRIVPVRAEPSPVEPPRRIDWQAVEMDSDLEAFFPPGSSVEDPFDQLSDPVLETLFPGESEPGEAGPELSGQLGYFNNTDVLQMLEGARATGVLYLEVDEGFVEIHLAQGRICGCFSGRPDVADEYETLLRWIVVQEGRFRFVPCRVKTNLRAGRSTTELLLHAQLRLDGGPLTV
jgi:hypothetical protein